MIQILLQFLIILFNNCNFGRMNIKKDLNLMKHSNLIEYIFNNFQLLFLIIYLKIYNFYYNKYTYKLSKIFRIFIINWHSGKERLSVVIAIIANINFS